jgi:hypothetical protein
MAQHNEKAQDYRDRAAAELTAGAAASLDQVRMKHERAARVWTDMAEAEDAREAEKAARRAAAAPQAD